MKVYVNGCSFSYGNTIDNKFAWPDCLPFDIINESWIAGSNKRIVRRTKDFLEHNDCKHVILQFTDPIRDEFYDEDFDIWVGQQGPHLHFDDKSYKRNDLDQQLIKIKWDNYKKFNSLARSQKQIDFETDFLVHGIIKYFEDNNINYLITSMSKKCLPKSLTKNVLEPISHIVNLENTYEDGHPNKEGHEQFSRYIMSEIEKKWQI